MTVSSPGHPASDDPLASQRTELLGRVAAAELRIDTVIAALRAQGADISALSEQLGNLAALRAEIATANPNQLVSLQQIVAISVANAAAATQQVQTTASTAFAADLAVSSSASRRAVNSAMDYMGHVPLKFASSEDEAEYHKREEERRAYIAAQQAKHTPEGDLNAAGGAVGQMVDAKAHGASGPEFEKRSSELISTTERFRATAKANGVSTEEFDSRLREEVRSALKAKGLSDAQIDAQFAAHDGDPLATAKALLHGDSEGIAKEAGRLADGAAPAVKESNAPPPPAVDDPFAKLRQSGVTLAASNPSDGFAHGVNTRAAPAADVAAKI